MSATDLIKGTDIYTFLHCCSNFAVPFLRLFSGSSVTLVVPSSVSTVFSSLRSATVLERWNRLSTCSSVFSSYLHEMPGEQLMTVAKKKSSTCSPAGLFALHVATFFLDGRLTRKNRFVDATTSGWRSVSVRPTTTSDA